MGKTAKTVPMYAFQCRIVCSSQSMFFEALDEMQTEIRTLQRNSEQNGANFRALPEYDDPDLGPGDWHFEWVDGKVSAMYQETSQTVKRRLDWSALRRRAISLWERIHKVRW